MTITVTLKSLRENGACIDGYNKVVRALQGRPFSEKDTERETYIRFAHKDPVPLSLILDSNGIEDALWALRACDQARELRRACRLFAVWCARRVQHLMTDPRSLAALDVAERHANGNATDEELIAAWAAARDAAWAAAWAAARAAAWAAARAAARAAAWDGARAAAWDAAWAAAWDAAWDGARAAAWDAQRDMFARVFCGESLNTDALYEKESRDK